MLRALADRGANGCGIVEVWSDSFGRFGMDSRGSGNTATLIVLEEGGICSGCTGGADMQRLRFPADLQVSLYGICRLGFWSRIGSADIVE